MATGSSDPFSANLLKTVFSPKLVSVNGGYQAKVDLINVDYVNISSGVIFTPISSAPSGVKNILYVNTSNQLRFVDNTGQDKTVTLS